MNDHIPLMGDLLIAMENRFLLLLPLGTRAWSESSRHFYSVVEDLAAPAGKTWEEYPSGKRQGLPIDAIYWENACGNQ